MSEIRMPGQDEIHRGLAEARRLRSEHFAAGVSRVGRTIIGVARAIGETFRKARRQQALYEELSRMTDFELRDIGLNRSDIPAVVAGVLTREAGPKTPMAGAATETDPAPAAPHPSDERIAA